MMASADRSSTYWMLRPLRLYAKFSGRACRMEQWKFSLLVLAMMVCVSLVGLDLIAAPIMLIAAVPLFSVTVRRLHDTDRSGLWLLLPLVGVALLFLLALIAVFSGSVALDRALSAVFMLTFVATLFVLAVLCALPGASGSNQFGPDPLAQSAPPSG